LSPGNSIEKLKRTRIMITKTVKSLALAFIISIGGMAASSGTANAGSVQVDFRFDGPGLYFSSGRSHYRDHRSRRQYRDHPSRRQYRDHRYRDDYGYRRRTCKPGRAYRKARRMGIRDAHIVRVNRRVIVLKGYKHGYSTRVKFSRSRHCPVISVRNRRY
jgi:hypothetical protein